MISDYPSAEDGHAFATMILAGLTPTDAIAYFLDGDEDPVVISEAIRKWKLSRHTKAAMRTLMGKAFHEMSPQEQMETALRIHYAQLGAMLVTHHYAEASAQEKAKLDSARTALEAKVAGTAGKGDALARFFDDISTGRVKLAAPPSGLPGRPN